MSNSNINSNNINSGNISVGKVILVGAGPGDAGLLTVKGLKALETADVIVYDRLVGTEILSGLSPAVRKINVGKSGGSHPIPQDEINKILLEEAKKGNIVVRLKGGDPFLFGRGGEELELLKENNIAFEIISGITSAIAVPCSAGIPVTHREYCSSVHIITGHTKNEKLPDIDFGALARLGGTLVFLMGLGAAADISKALLSAGKPAETPVAVIQNGSTARQKTISTTLADMSADIKKAQFEPPAIIVIGEICELREQFEWFEKRPLHGKRIVVTRPRGRIGALCEKIRKSGGEAIAFPCIETESNAGSGDVRNAVRNIHKFQWVVFTSAFGVKVFFETLKVENMDARALHSVRIAVIGSGTRQEFEQKGILVNIMPENYHISALAQLLACEMTENEEALLFRAREGSEELPRILSEKKLNFTDVAAYETVYTTEHCSEAAELVKSGDYDFAAFTSASTVKGFVKSLNGVDFTKVNALCIGNETAKEAEKHGMNIFISEKATIDSMVEMLMKL